MRALDLFAGTGWGVACKRLGIQEMGVELMPEAVATREANGMATIYHDVWEGLTGNLYVPHYDILIASPPCQTFSLAGKGAGRAALDEVLEAIRLEAWKDPQQLLEFGERHDMRTALVLTPLAHVWRDRPRLVTMEQVPTVLPVWEAVAVEMRKLGYSVQVANLHAEQYGVPQTRKRAILVARLDGPVAMPMPTHSKYYPREPKRLDPDVQPWVSMADALGWGMNDASMHTVFRNGNQAHAARREARQAAPTLHFGQRSNKVEWMDRGLAGDPAASGVRVTTEQAAALQTYPVALRPEIEAWEWVDAPATTIAGDPRITAREHHFHGEQSKTSLRLEQGEAATLQTYERPFTWCGTKSKIFLQIGNAVPPLLAEAILAALTSNSLALSHSI